MKQFSKINFGVLYATILLASTSVSALTLGRIQGGALLGKELDVSVAVQYGTEEDVSAGCFAADVRFGDALVESGRLTLKVQPGSQAGTQIVHITSSARIEDAVVTVNLKANCGQKTSRRYVLLSDVVSELAGSSTSKIPEVSVSLEAKENAKDAGKPQIGLAAAQPAVNMRPAKPVMRAKKQTEGGATLKVVAAAASVEQANAVKVASQANAQAVEELQRRVEGIEQWQSKTTVADDLLKSGERANVLQTDIQGLTAITAKNQQNLQTVAMALERAESESYGRSLVYALGALLAACIAAVAFVFTRVRNGAVESAPWWLGGEQRTEAGVAPKQPAGAHRSEPDRMTASVEKVSTQDKSKVGVELTASPNSASQDEVVDIDLGDEVSATATAARQPEASASQSVPPTDIPADATNSAYSQLRAINTKEMLDIRQQAEFFMALGQHDDAVELLVSSIRDNADANPLVFLDLLKIFHTLSRRVEFDRYREEFNLHFTGRIPSYTNFLMEGNGLESYEDIVQQIVVLWPTEYTIDFIEQCLVRTPEDDPEQGIDLEAFNDLLLLYGVLKRLDQPTDSAMVPFSTSRTASSQMGAIGQAGAVANTIFDNGDPSPLPVIPGAQSAGEVSVDLHLDLDLDGEQPPETQDPNGNLIDFDMSGFAKPEQGKGPK
jgi:pilus assembly protein FimV